MWDMVTLVFASNCPLLFAVCMKTLLQLVSMMEEVPSIWERVDKMKSHRNQNFPSLNAAAAAARRIDCYCSA